MSANSYLEIPIKTDGVIFQLADSVAYPARSRNEDGSYSPKQNAKGEFTYEVNVLITTGDKMNLTKLKVNTPTLESPVEGMKAGEVINLFAPLVYFGEMNGRSFAGVKASGVAREKADK